MWLNAKEGQLSGLSRQEKANCAFALHAFEPLGAVLKVSILNPARDNQRQFELFGDILSSYVTRTVFDFQKNSSSQELMSICHGDLVDLVKSGLRCSSVDFGFEVKLPGNHSRCHITSEFLNYSKGLSGKRYPGDRLEISINSTQLKIDKKRIVAKLRPGVKWVLRFDADKYEKFLVFLKKEDQGDVVLIGRPELYFGLSSKKTSIFDVESFTWPC